MILKKLNFLFTYTTELITPAFVWNVDPKTQIIASTRNNVFIQNNAYWSKYQNTWKDIVETLNENTIKEPFYEFDLGVDLNKLGTKYALFATYLKLQTTNKFARELPIVDKQAKFNDLFTTKFTYQKH